MAGKDLQGILEDLLSRVAGSRGAVLVDGEGIAIAQASRGSLPQLETLGTGCTLLLRESVAAADQLGHGPVTHLLLETERAILTLIPLKAGCSLCLLLAPDAIPGRCTFEARRAALALENAL
jgi:predicted regulator of Ras-like GTPase activity (Roadblock/LC7/MglB family)